MDSTGYGGAAPRRPRPVRGAAAVAAALAATALFLVLTLVPATRSAGLPVYSAVAVGLLVAMGVRVARMDSGRLPWVQVGAGALLLVASQLSMLWSVPGGAVDLQVGVFAAHPWLAVTGLLAYLVLYSGQMGLLRQRVEGVLPSAWLDGLVATLLIAALTFAFVVPGVRHHTGLGALAAAALTGRPALDLFLVSFALANCALSGWRAQRLVLVAASVATLLVADVLGVLRLVGALHVPGLGPSVDAGRLVALGLLVAAPWRSAPTTTQRVDEGRAVLIGPASGLLGSLALLVVDQLHPLGAAAACCAMASIAGVGIKFALVYEEVQRLADSRRQALTDELTGLANRRALVLALDGVGAAEAPVGLLLIDLDRFKDVNDRFGHSAGDDLLRTTATRLTDLVPSSGVLARLGGDEFAVLLPATGLQDAHALARLIATGLSAPTAVAGRSIDTGASIGVAGAGAGSGAGAGIDGQELLRRADAAMYLAKGAGGGCAVYDEDVDAAAAEESLLLEELRTALDAQGPRPEHEQIVVHYQPQLELATGAVVGVEALVRWRHPRRGVLAPDAFLDLVEAHGLMEAVTTRVMHQAAADAAQWRRAGHPLRVAVNLSTSCLGNPALLVLIDDVLAETGLAPGALVAEITETMLMADPAQALATVQAIAGRGVEVSIDDYGTGYSSLAYLDALPACELKLDRAFTTRVVADERTASIVATTVDLAHRLGMRLIAEGVEDTETLDALRALGCDETQGYLHSRPVPAAALTRWLAERAALAAQAPLEALER